MKNKISTLGYFMKRLKDNKFVVWKIFDAYSMADWRKWTVLVNPGYQSIYITCCVDNQSLKPDPIFSFDDGGAWGMKKNERLQTKSMEIIINKLVEHGVTPDSTYYTERENDG
jgi:hypothetical protein